MKIQCGNCGRRHESVDAVKACYAGQEVPAVDPQVRAAVGSRQTELALRAEERKSHATKNTMGGSSSGRMATEKMERYAGNLAAERDMHPATASEILTKIKAGTLTFDRARQFINDYKNAPRRTDRKQTAPSAVSEDGMYRNPDTGEIYKVQYNKVQGDGRRLYAKRLVLSGQRVDAGEIVHNVTPGTPLLPDTAQVTFVYAGSPSRAGIRPEWKMTAEEARAFGALYGSCCQCGSNLTRESSVAHGYGPTCAENNGWPYDPKAVPA